MASSAVYIALIFLANWLIIHVGFIYVWPGILAPAGVYCAGLTFPARDVIQRALGRPAGIAAIVLASAITMLISPRLALASGTTFLVSESMDMLIYTPFQRRWFIPAVIFSSVVAAITDSLLFLWLAGIPYSIALKGQIVGKLEVIFLVGIPLAVILRNNLPFRAVLQEDS